MGLLWHSLCSSLLLVIPAKAGIQFLALFSVEVQSFHSPAASG